MARPRLIEFRQGVRAEHIRTLYVDEGLSTREVARRLHLSRWIVVTRLHEMQVPLRGRDDAAALARLIRERDYEQDVASHCRWPDCSNEVEFEMGVCPQHLDYLVRERSTHCRWSLCDQTSLRGSSLCYRHEKIANGLMG